MDSVKRSDTAELRRRFDTITALLADGFNHKQICEHLNTQGLAIPYPQYRAIMTRLRREKTGTGTSVMPPAQPVQAANIIVRPSASESSLNKSDDASEQAEPEKKFSWNPGSEVKWK